MFEISSSGVISESSHIDDYIYGALTDVFHEIHDAARKHGWGNVPTNPDISAEKAFIILAEEFGEVARALTHDEGSDENLDDELIQTAAMAVATLVGLRRRNVV